MEYNTCKVCGANEGRAGNLWTSPEEQIESACQNCNDSLRTGNMVMHANLSRTTEELDRMMAAVAIRHNRVKGNEMATSKQLKAADIAEVKAVKTSDGKLWEDSDAALAHQNKINFEQMIGAFAEEYGYSEMGRDGLKSLLLERADELLAILERKA